MVFGMHDDDGICRGGDSNEEIMVLLPSLQYDDDGSRPLPHPFFAPQFLGCP